MNWLRTRGGIEFLVAGDRFVVTEPMLDSSGWCVGHCRREGAVDGLREAVRVTEEQARQIAELFAQVYCDAYADSKKPQPISDELAIEQASARLDSMAPPTDSFAAESEQP